MTTIKSKAISVKNHVRRHRVAYTAGVTATVFILLMNRSSKELTAFLEEKGIDPLEYFCPEFYEELKAEAL